MNIVKNETNRLALVCGSSDGLGLACARALASNGARVILTGRNNKKLQAALLSLTGENHSYFVCDLSSKKSVNSLISHIQGLMQRVSILVNNSGGPPPGSLIECTTEDFEVAMNGHLYAAHNLSRALIPGMRSNGFGRIINIVSVTGKTPLEMLGVSNVVRGAMLSWAKTLSLEIAKDLITVNSILPGYTNTNRLNALVEKQVQQRGVSADSVKAKWISETPVGRLGEPEELGALAAFLASEAASFINGTSIPVDGGWTRGL